MVLPGSSRARRRQAHWLTQQHLSRSSGDWPRRRSCWPLADPSPAQSAPAPRAWPSAPAPHACSPAWKVCFLVSSDPREKFKETQLGPSWATSSALNQGIKMHFSASLLSLLLAKWPLPVSPKACLQICAKVSQKLAKPCFGLSFYAQRLIQIICQSTLPVFKRFPLKMIVLKACQGTCQGLCCQLS